MPRHFWHIIAYYCIKIVIIGTFMDTLTNQILIPGLVLTFFFVHFVDSGIFIASFYRCILISGLILITFTSFFFVFFLVLWGGYFTNWPILILLKIPKKSSKIAKMGSKSSANGRIVKILTF